MNMPISYPATRVPMYVVTIVEPTSRLVESGYKTRAELIDKIKEVESSLTLTIIKEDDCFVTQSIPMSNGNTFIITTIFVQITNANE